MKRKFAAFDIDGTIARSALFFQVVDQLISDGHLPSEARSELDSKYEKYLKREHENAFREYSQLSVDVLFENMHEIKVVDYKKAVDAVIAKSSSYVYTYTRDLVKKLKGQGYFIIALSGSENYAVKEFTKQFGFDLSIGETYHERDGKLTGEAEVVFKNKDILLKKYIKEHDLVYADSFAVGDTLSDTKMLGLVENPIAFNPDKKLFEYAKERGWKIVVERKNVIYELEPENGNFILA